ncbi:hypothetical protein [Peribacillus frigoritolerans]|uniref:hypothetical protein n=1 Tax=Peribacillus frigoritolerans TaxID=450367 RepID=UPI00227EA035|nr:hypothetical protein [Peribacillus frigoritolerans]MCY8939157.1 hypothetical protein [Peribacillus frigoritolerans]
MYSKPIVFTDYHHGSLLLSLILLFERRLGGECYTPFGTDWYTQGFWKLFGIPHTVDQYLNVNTAVPLETNNSIYVYPDIGFTNKGITLQGFYQMPIDIVIASIPAHIIPFKRLCKSHPNKPKLIYQIGNSWNVEAGLAPNIMASSEIKSVPKNLNFLSYHQEFDLSLFYPDFSYPSKTISSFVNCFTTSEGFASDWTCYSRDWALFESVEKLMSDWTFKSYGHVCRDGYVTGPNEVANRMRESRFIWHTKFGGDGYGHIIYNTAAVARPMIVKMEYYRDKLGKELMIDGKTCIAIDGLSPQEVVNKILYYSDEKRYSDLCSNVYKNFKTKVDFDKEEKVLRKFIDSLR